jgi:hypothetical protein
MKKLITILTLMPCLCFGQWNQLGTDISGSVAGDEFGSSVAFNSNGETFVTGTQNNNSSTGTTQIYEWDGTDWAQKGTDINGVNSGEQFGQSVDISADGNTVLIGAPSGGIASSPGYSAVYEWDGTSWIQKGTNIIGENTNLNAAGGSVSISANGNIIAIGASGNTNGNASYAGHVRIYEWNGATWVQQGADIDGLNQFDGFGGTVSLNSSGNLVAISAIGAGIGGEVKVLQWNGTNWLQLGATLVGGTNNAFGNTVDLDTLGTTLSVGATSNDADFGAGYVEVFSWDGMNWNQKGMRLESDPTGDDFHEIAKLSADGNILVVGAYGAENGFVTVFKFDGVNWNTVDNVILGENDGDFFGVSVDISDDGSKIVVGARQNDSNGANAGEIKIFENLTFLSLDDNSTLHQVNVFPNPFNNYIQIISEIDLQTYTLTSLDGKTIKSENFNNLKELTIDLSEIKTGVYILNIKSINTSKNFKIIKK